MRYISTSNQIANILVVSKLTIICAYSKSRRPTLLYSSKFGLTTIRADVALHFNPQSIAKFEDYNLSLVKKFGIIWY